MRNFYWLLICVFLLPTVACARFESNGIELVLTAPVDSGLDASDLRNPVDVWVEMIDGARNSIDLHQMYAVSEVGEPLEAVMQALERAGARGVKIRMLLEKKMARASSKETVARLEKIPEAEIKVVEFSKIGVDGIIHVKAITVDGRDTFVGSQNFDWRSVKHIHEVGIRTMRPELVKQVQAAFDYDWNHLVLKKKKSSDSGAGAADAYVVGSPAQFLPKGMRPSEAELVSLIAGAKSELAIQVMEYSRSGFDRKPYTVIDNALRAAAARGVKVRLLVSNWNTEKPAIDDMKSLARVPNVEVKITTIPEAREGFIPFARVTHSKYMVVDGAIAWVGTSNWTGGYLDKSRNLEIVMKDGAMAERLRALFEQVWSSPHSEALDLNKVYPKPRKG